MIKTLRHERRLVFSKGSRKCRALQKNLSSGGTLNLFGLASQLLSSSDPLTSLITDQRKVILGS